MRLLHKQRFVVGQVPIQERRRIEFSLHPPDFEMQMGSGGTPRRAGIRHDLTLLNELARLHFKTIQMPIIGHKTKVMDQHQQVAETAFLVVGGKIHDTIGSGEHRRTLLRLQIHAVVKLLFAAYRVGTHPIGTVDFPAFDGSSTRDALEHEHLFLGGLAGRVQPIKHCQALVGSEPDQGLNLGQVIAHLIELKRHATELRISGRERQAAVTDGCVERLILDLQARLFGLQLLFAHLDVAELVAQHIYCKASHQHRCQRHSQHRHQSTPGDLRQ